MDTALRLFGGGAGGIIVSLLGYLLITYRNRIRAIRHTVTTTKIDPKAPGSQTELKINVTSQEGVSHVVEILCVANIEVTNTTPTSHPDFILKVSVPDFVEVVSLEHLNPSSAQTMTVNPDTVPIPQKGVIVHEAHLVPFNRGRTYQLGLTMVPESDGMRSAIKFKYDPIQVHLDSTTPDVKFSENSTDMWSKPPITGFNLRTSFIFLLVSLAAGSGYMLIGHATLSLVVALVISIMGGVYFGTTLVSVIVAIVVRVK